MAPTPASDTILTDTTVGTTTSTPSSIATPMATNIQGGDMLGTQPSGGLTNHVGIGIGIAILILVVTMTVTGVCWLMFIKKRRQSRKPDSYAYKINEDPPPYSLQHSAPSHRQTPSAGSSANDLVKQLPQAHTTPPRP